MITLLRYIWYTFVTCFVIACALGVMGLLLLPLLQLIPRPAQAPPFYLVVFGLFAAWGLVRFLKGARRGWKETANERQYAKTRGRQ
jgi:hypothetical protein